MRLTMQTLMALQSCPEAKTLMNMTCTEIKSYQAPHPIASPSFMANITKCSIAILNVHGQSVRACMRLQKARKSLFFLALPQDARCVALRLVALRLHVKKLCTHTHTHTHTRPN